MHPLLSQGRQDSGLARIKSGGSLQCGISDWPMTGWGHKLALPHCNILSRFTPISRHNPKAARQETLTRKTGRLGGVFQPPNRADIVRLTYSKYPKSGSPQKRAWVPTGRCIWLLLITIVLTFLIFLIFLIAIVPSPCGFS